MWNVECQKKGIYFASQVEVPPGQNSFVMWHIYGSAANVILGSVSVDLDVEVARVRKPLLGGEEMVIDLHEGVEYKTMLFEGLSLVNNE